MNLDEAIENVKCMYLRLENGDQYLYDLSAILAAMMQAKRELESAEKVVAAAESVLTLLHNLTWENKDTLQRCLHGRWYIHHEPLRNDAATHKARIEKALAQHESKEGT